MSIDFEAAANSPQFYEDIRSLYLVLEAWVAITLNPNLDQC